MSKTARDRAAERGRVFKPISDVVTMIAERRRFIAMARHPRRGVRRVRTVAEQRTAIEPLTDAQRTWNYVRQNGVRRPLTARQQRRRRHKAHRQGLA